MSPKNGSDVRDGCGGVGGIHVLVNAGTAMLWDAGCLREDAELPAVDRCGLFAGGSCDIAFAESVSC